MALITVIVSFMIQGRAVMKSLTGGWHQPCRCPRGWTWPRPWASCRGVLRYRRCQIQAWLSFIAQPQSTYSRQWSSWHLQWFPNSFCWPAAANQVPGPYDSRRSLGSCFWRPKSWSRFDLGRNRPAFIGVGTWRLRPCCVTCTFRRIITWNVFSPHQTCAHKLRSSSDQAQKSFSSCQLIFQGTTPLRSSYRWPWPWSIIIG